MVKSVPRQGHDGASWRKVCQQRLRAQKCQLVVDEMVFTAKKKLIGSWDGQYKEESEVTAKNVAIRERMPKCKKA